VAASTSSAPVRAATPTLDQFGSDLTSKARTGTLGPLVGRDAETDLVIETLCRHAKRNPLLIGPAGVGKTAIVEGFAQRLIRGSVPTQLRGARLIGIQPSALVAGASARGEVEKRVQAMLAEASQNGVILFIDEVHSMVGAGGAGSTADIASLMKPALARDALACIAATTDDEYRRLIEPDAALERRFQPIRVQELTPEQTRALLVSVRDTLAGGRGVEVGDDVLAWLVNFADEFLRNRHFPDKAVDLLEECVAHAVARGEDRIALADAQAVARRMVGAPLGVEERLQALDDRLKGAGVLLPEDVSHILARLNVTFRGLQVRSARPNLVLLLAGSSAADGEGLAELLAESLYGSPQRVVAIDFEQLTQPSDINALIGSPPGYVGYGERLALHELLQMPWCVLHWRNVDACHPRVRQLLTSMLDQGYVTDARGARIYLSDAVVLATAGTSAQAHLSSVLGAEFLDQVDVICAAGPSAGSAQAWLGRALLPSLAARFAKQGLHVRWDTSLIDWLARQQPPGATRRQWERFLERSLCPILIDYLPRPGAAPGDTLLVRFQAGRVEVLAGCEGAQAGVGTAR
jgi:ATP-dependent Clp protease ATP-binding subunit ClpC